MPSQAKKYYDYACACARLAVQAKTNEVRDRLIDLAGVWMDAAANEDALAAVPRPSRTPNAATAARRFRTPPGT